MLACVSCVVYAHILCCTACVHSCRMPLILLYRFARAVCCRSSTRQRGPTQQSSASGCTPSPHSSSWAGQCQRPAASAASPSARCSRQQAMTRSCCCWAACTASTTSAGRAGARSRAHAPAASSPCRWLATGDAVAVYAASCGWLAGWSQAVAVCCGRHQRLVMAASSLCRWLATGDSASWHQAGLGDGNQVVLGHLTVACSLLLTATSS